jgi:hypothetical protein
MIKLKNISFVQFVLNPRSSARVASLRTAVRNSSFMTGSVKSEAYRGNITRAFGTAQVEPLFGRGGDGYGNGEDDRERNTIAVWTCQRWPDKPRAPGARL